MALSSLFQQPIPDNPFMQRKRKNWLDYSPDDVNSASDPADVEISSGTEEDPTFEEIYRNIANVESGPKAKAYSDYVTNVPTREMNKPGRLDRLAAILGGASEGYFGGAGRGINLAHNILDNRYNQAIEDYKVREPGMRAAAAQEESDLGKRVTLARNIEAGIRGKRTDEERKRVNDSQILRRSIQNYKDLNPNVVFHNINGRVMAINPANPEEQQDLGDANILSPNAVGQKQAIETFNQNAIGKRQVGVAAGIAPITRETNRQNAENQGNKEVDVAERTQPLKKEIEGIRQENRVDLKGTPTAGNNNATPNAERTRLRNNANDVVSKHPELAKYIKIGTGTGANGNGLPTGDVQLAMPSFFNVGTGTKEEFDKAYELVHAGSAAPKAQDKSGPEKGTKKTFPNGKVGVWDGTGWVAQ